MKKIVNNPVFILLWSIVIILIVFLMIRFLVNYRYTSNYSTEEFKPSDLNLLFFGNFSQSYVAYFNKGNIEFDNGNYENAINEYTKALEKKPPEEKECKIRINLAFAKLKLLNMDATSEEKKKELIENLREIQKVLTEKGCATDDNTGHDKDAQTLKNDIDNFIKALESNEEPQKDPEPKPSQQTDPKEEKLRKELEELKRRGSKERKEMEELFTTHEYNFGGKIW